MCAALTNNRLLLPPLIRARGHANSAVRRAAGGVWRGARGGGAARAPGSNTRVGTRGVHRGARLCNRPTVKTVGVQSQHPPRAPRRPRARAPGGPRQAKGGQSRARQRDRCGALASGVCACGAARRVAGSGARGGLLSGQSALPPLQPLPSAAAAGRPPGAGNGPAAAAPPPRLPPMLRAVSLSGSPPLLQLVLCLCSACARACVKTNGVAAPARRSLLGVSGSLAGQSGQLRGSPTRSSSAPSCCRSSRPAGTGPRRAAGREA